MKEWTCDWVNELLRAAEHDDGAAALALVQDHHQDPWLADACLQAAMMSQSAGVMAVVLPCVTNQHAPELFQIALRGGRAQDSVVRNQMVNVVTAWADARQIDVPFACLEQAVYLNDLEAVTTLRGRFPEGRRDQWHGLALAALRKSQFEMIEVLLTSDDHEDFDRLVVKAMMAPFWREKLAEPQRMYRAIQENKALHAAVGATDHARTRRSKL